MSVNLSASWIWDNRIDGRDYNRAIIACRRFKLESCTSARIAITADTWYRLIINGEWIADGPARGWPEHYKYDDIDVSTYLTPGRNEISVMVRSFGIGTFHQVPQRGGLLAQLEITGDDGAITTIVTDRKWKTAPWNVLAVNVPKSTVQSGPFELVDARREADTIEFAAASVVCATQAGPWRDLQPRDCPLLTLTPTSPKAFVGANVVSREFTCFGFAVLRLAHPHVVTANNSVTFPCLLATHVYSPEPTQLPVSALGLAVTVNGQPVKDGVVALNAGDNFLLAYTSTPNGHRCHDIWINFTGCDPRTAFGNPLDPTLSCSWCAVVLDQYLRISDDIKGLGDFPMPELKAKLADYAKHLVTAADFTREFGERIRHLSGDDLILDESYQHFINRKALSDGVALVKAPAALMSNNAAVTTVLPSADGDIELCYDLGEQNCGYYQFALTAAAGTIVDFAGIEYITPDGKLQHTGCGYRNGMRYICHDGLNGYTSVVRRSQRYIFITLRKQTTPVQIRSLSLIESTYPVEPHGRFSCSDTGLDRVWEISARTLKLCMEDTYTDCPLYEQTLWVGDARNEALFGMTAFGATDLSKRCILIAGESLERYPLVGSQVPSCWDVLLPAWSFLWGLSVWDCFFFTADREFLARIFPMVVKNLRGAEALCTDRGLFSGPFWNMFDWSGADQGHRTVLHNTMFMVGAIDSASKCAETLGATSELIWLADFRVRAVNAINALWNPERGVYPDSIHNDSSISPSTCRHTHFLSLLYDIANEQIHPTARQHTLNPPEGMVPLGSPFASMYLFEALEKIGCPDQIVADIRTAYLPMLQLGATTVWEQFPTGTFGPKGFPTRSHCHAWSSAPIYFLNRIILGIMQTVPGGAAVEISPRPNGLTWANGATMTAKGPVSVAWTLTDNQLEITAKAPAGVNLSFKHNDALAKYKVIFNGQIHKPMDEASQ